MKHTGEDKIISFRTLQSNDRKLKKQIFDEDTSKKDWLNDKIMKGKNVQDLSLQGSERWLTIPSMEYTRLLGESKTNHGEFIASRIHSHLYSANKEITFFTLFQEMEMFYELNKIHLIKTSSESCSFVTIYSKHNLGMNFSRFGSDLITELQTYSEDYDIIEETISVNSFSVLLIPRK